MPGISHYSEEEEMRKERSLGWAVTALLLVASMLLASCAPATAAPTQAPVATEAPTQAATEAATEAATAAPTEAPTEPATGGTLDPAQFSPDIVVPDEEITLTFASWVHTGQPDDEWEVLAKEFHDLYPNITIEFQDIPSEEMHDKLLTQIAANNPPDAAYIDSGTLGEFGLRGALVKLDDFISKSNVIKTDDYLPAFLSAATVESSYYGLPIDGETTGLFYRTDRFQEAGLDPNKPPTTWEEFQADAEKLTDAANKKYGYAIFATDYESSYYFLPWLWQAGGLVLNPDDPNDVIVDNEAGKKAADFYVNLKKYSPADLLNSNSYDGRTAFANGDVAMYMAGAWFAGTLLSEFPDATGKWAAAPLPQDQKCATTVASDDLVIFSGGKHPEAAYKWIEFVSAPDHMRELNLGTPDSPSTLLPPRQSLLDDPKTYENREVLKGFADAMKCAFIEPAVQPKYYVVDEALYQNLNKAFYGEFPDGAAAMDAAAKQAEENLKKP